MNFSLQNISADIIFGGQNFSADKIFGSKLNFRHFCPPKFCPIRYPPLPSVGRQTTENNPYFIKIEVDINGSDKDLQSLDDDKEEKNYHQFIEATKIARKKWGKSSIFSKDSSMKKEYN